MATTAKARRRRNPPQKSAGRKVILAVPSVAGARPVPPSPLKLVRTARGFTLTQLARQLHVNHSLLSLIENGLLTPTPTLVGRLEAVLDSDAKTLGFPKAKEVLHAG